MVSCEAEAVFEREGRGKMATETNWFHCEEKPSLPRLKINGEREREREIADFKRTLCSFLGISALKKRPRPFWVHPLQGSSGPLLCPPVTEEQWGEKAAGLWEWRILCTDVFREPMGQASLRTPTSSGHSEIGWPCWRCSFNDHEYIQFSSVQLLSRVRLFATPWITARQASLSISTPGVHSDSRPSSQWCHPAISSSVIPFSSCPQSLPASESFPMSQLFAWGGQSTGVSALASFLPKKSQGWSTSEWTGWIYWVDPKVHPGFSIQYYMKTWGNFWPTQ